MLKEKQKEIPYSLVFKTSSGEEFIGKVIEETEHYYSVESPSCIVQAGEGFRFAPYMFLADPKKSITIPKPVITGIPAESIRSQFESITSGIALPQKSAIIT